MTDLADHPTGQASARASARDRLLAAAAELFYAEGIHTVGIDRVIERAGVAKASLYNTFGSKDDLVRAYLQDRHAVTAARIEAGLARWDDPRERLLGMFVLLGERMEQPNYHGCPFVSASAESPPGSVAFQEAEAYRTFLRGRFAELAADAGVRDSEALARQLLGVYDGAGLAMRIDGNRQAAESARVAAAALLDAALASS